MSEGEGLGANVDAGAGQDVNDAGTLPSSAEGPDGGSLLTRDSADGDGQATKETQDAQGSKKTDGREAADQAAVVPDKPEGYKLTFAEGITVDEPLLKSFQAEAHALGIPQGQAQKLADFYTKHAGDAVAASQKAHTAAMVEAKKGWEAEITARPGFKQEVADARRTLKEFGGEKLNELMDHSLLGSHPVFFDFVVKVGKALAEPNSRGAGNAAGKEKPLMDRMWPNMK